jgi:hypothetical protein
LSSGRRATQIVHGRVAMLAALGWVVQELWHPLFNGQIEGVRDATCCDALFPPLALTYRRMRRVRPGVLALPAGAGALLAAAHALHWRFGDDARAQRLGGAVAWQRVQAAPGVQARCGAERPVCAHGCAVLISKQVIWGGTRCSCIRWRPRAPRTCRRASSTTAAWVRSTHRLHSLFTRAHGCASMRADARW